MMLISVLLISIFIAFSSASGLIVPPQTALIIGFENTYDISLLANTLSDQGIDATLIVPSGYDIYENLIDVNVIKLNLVIDESMSNETKALKACESLLSDKDIIKKIGEIQPTFVIFSALRHDACLLPWTRFISSIPVLWALGADEEHYAIEKTKVGIPISIEGIYDRFWTNIKYRTAIAHADGNYVGPALKLVQKYLKSYKGESLSELYLNVELLFWGADPILRTDFASLTHRFVEIGCHHCRAPLPLPSDLQKDLVEFRLGTIVVTLDDRYRQLIETIARQLPQGRQGQAVVWKTKSANLFTAKPENLFPHSTVDRQDIIGYARARVLLSHCDDTQFLEAAFHGTPVICIPRSLNEKKNAERAVELGFSVNLNSDYSSDNILRTIIDVHESASYRETARSISQVIRDRPMPATDRLVFWLGYVARNDKRAIEFSPIEKGIPVKTFAEDVQLYIGMLIGTAFGVLFAVTTALTWYLQGQSTKSTKIRSKRHNK